MPVRIYDIAKRLGVESKRVLTKAKELGIAAAKVPSSTLDKITAEYLVQEMGGVKPLPLAEPIPAEPIAVIAAPPEPPPPSPVPEIVIESPPAVIEIVAVPAQEAPPTPPSIAPTEVQPEEVRTEEIVTEPPPVEPATVSPPPPRGAPPQTVDRVEALPPLPPPPPPPTPPPPPVPAAPSLPPPPPAPPPGPKVGDKVGFIHLPTRLRPVEKPGVVRQAPPRPGVPDRFRTDRNARPGTAPARSGSPAGRPALAGAGKAGDTGKGATDPRFVPLTTGEIITIKPPIVVHELAEKLNRKPFQIIADLMEMGVFANKNQSIDESTAQRICAKYGFRFEVEKRAKGEGLVHSPVKPVTVDIEDKEADLKPRAPVVTIMGHVDHGKTTLLDVIRKSDVAAGESGGITQHIGAYTIAVPHPERKGEMQQITFLDTPGHAAFSAMRARGANVTDIVILVVAANDGVMPQTLEALSHARSAKVPIIVAVNKSDHPNANSLKVRQQLQDKGLVPDDWGGNTFFVDCSALTKQGVDKLLEMICFQADLLELKANPLRPAKGNVIESGLEPGGPTATVLVRKGTLHVGDVIICGQYYGKVRALINEEGNRLKEAAPSVAVKVLGLNGVPEAGLEFSVAKDDRTARDEAEIRAQEARQRGQESATPKVSLENLFAVLDEKEAKVLKIVVKADTQGSVEAIVEALKKIESEKVALEIIHSAVGTITESDVMLASASHAIVLGFHTRIDGGVGEAAKREGIQIKLYTIIYELIDEVKLAMAGLLDPLVSEVVIGSAEVRQIFELSKGTPVAGCMVSSGRIVRGKVRVRRRKNLIYEGLTQSLRRFQDEVNEVRVGLECGIRIEGFGDYQIGDNIECYALEKATAKL